MHLQQTVLLEISIQQYSEHNYIFFITLWNRKWQCMASRSVSSCGRALTARTSGADGFLGGSGQFDLSAVI